MNLLLGVHNNHLNMTDQPHQVYVIILSGKPLKHLIMCLFVHLSVHPSVDEIVSVLCLPQYLPDPFHICTSYQPIAEGVLWVWVFENYKIWIIAKMFTS